jgi:hypothetical protein
VFAERDTFELGFARFGRFPEALRLAPEPDGPVRALTGAVEARWPEAPPYGGAFDAVPHLTVAGDQSQETYAAIERELAPGLPLRTFAARVQLVVCDGRRRHHRASLALRGGSAAGGWAGAAGGPW